MTLGKHGKNGLWDESVLEVSTPRMSLETGQGEGSLPTPGVVAGLTWTRLISWLPSIWDSEQSSLVTTFLPRSGI